METKQEAEANVAQIQKDIKEKEAAPLPNRRERRHTARQGRKSGKPVRSRMSKEQVRFLLPVMTQNKFEKPKKGPAGVQNPPGSRRKMLKPYRLILLQKKIDRLQQGIRALPHGDPKRAVLTGRMDMIKKQLGKQ